MNSKTKRIAVAVLAVPFIVSSTATFAAGPQDKEALHEAVESGNYQEWVELLPEGNEIATIITQDNFSRFAEAINLMKEGDREGAKAIFDELGVKPPHKKGHHGDGEKREELKAALDAGDYQAFLDALPEDAPMREKITEENFGKMIEAHQLMEAGDKEGARAIMEELGIERPDRGERKEMREEIKAVLESEDYQAWLELVPEDHPLGSQITEGNFSQFVEAHKLMESGDLEGAQTIMDELGIERPERKGNGKMKERIKNRIEG